MKATCRGCDATWSGLNICHCSVCHITTSCIKNFDLHRVRDKCVDPATITRKQKGTGELVPALKLNKHGVWVGTSDEARDFGEGS